MKVLPVGCSLSFSLLLTMLWWFSSLLPSSLLPHACLWCIFCPASYISSTLATSLVAFWWPQELLSPWHACGLGASAVFPVSDSPALTSHRNSWAPFHNCFQLFADVSGNWSLEAWKGAGNPKAKLSPADLAALHETSQCPFLRFSFSLVSLSACPAPSAHVSTSAIWSPCWSGYTFLNLNKLFILCWEKLHYKNEILSPNLYTFSKTAQEKFLFQNRTFLLFLNRKRLMKTLLNVFNNSKRIMKSVYNLTYCI